MKIRALFLMGLITGCDIQAWAQEPSCPLQESALFSERFPNLRAQSLELFARFYCRDHRTYFLALQKELFKLEQTEQSALTSQDQVEIDRFRLVHRITSAGHEAGLLGGDQRRILEFDANFKKARQGGGVLGTALSKIFPTKIFPKDTSPLEVQTSNQADKIFILVAGFGNEIARQTYFTDFSESLIRDFGVPPSQVERVFSNSLYSIEWNSKHIVGPILRKRLLEARAKNQEIVLVGHSMGGSIILQALADEPLLIEDPRIQRVATIQSPLKGTLVAELPSELQSWALDTYSRMLKALSKLNPQRWPMAECWLPSDDLYDSGAKSMLPKQTEARIQEVLMNLSDSQRASLNKKLFYFSTVSRKEFTKYGTYHLDEANDGTVPTERQYIRAIGRRLGHLENIGHTDLVVGGKKSSLNSRERKAFTQIFVNSLLDPMSEFEDGMD